MRFKQPISKIHLENQVMLANLMDLADAPDLPLYHTPNKPLHAVMGVVLGLVSLGCGLAGVLSIPVFWQKTPDTAWFLIGVVLGLGGLWVAFVYFANLLTLCHPYTLSIRADGVEFLRHDWQSEHEFIGFDRAYLSEFYAERRGGGRLMLYYIEFSDDGQYYKTHKVAIGRFFAYDKCNGHHYSDLIDALIQDYHKKHDLMGKVPQVRFIPQR